MCKHPIDTGFPCGQCLPCRINKRRFWTCRMMLEQKCHAESAFITLTYNRQHLPLSPNFDMVLRKKDWQDFLKRLRKRLGISLRFFAVGEYGDKGERPHYHAILFGYPPCVHGRTRYTGRGEARRLECCRPCGDIYESWGKGIVEVGPCNADTVQYTTGYVTKKMTSSKDKRLRGRPPEFVLMSRRPGLGYPYAKFLPPNRELMSIKIDGKDWPLDRYMREAILKAGGADVEKTKRVRMEAKQGAMQWLQANEASTYWTLKRGSIQKGLQRVAKAIQAEIRLRKFSRRKL